MSRHLSIEQLREREYWTPGDCARVLGHGRTFWVRALDEGHVEGYRLKGRARYLLVSSARAYLANGPRNTGVDFAALTRARMREFRRKFREGQQAAASGGAAE